jgi:ADP-ribose pyrophosphatase
MSHSNASPGSKAPNENLTPWQIFSERPVYEANPWMQVSVQQLRLPDGRTIDDYHQIRLTDFAVVYAETADGRVLVERQYKHGIGQVTLTLPAGMVEQGEDPLEGARRELLEETGYVADDWRNLGSYVVNSNYGCGRAYLFAARNARCVAAPNSGDLEEMTVELMPVADLILAARKGEVVALSSATALAMATHPLFTDARD